MALRTFIYGSCVTRDSVPFFEGHGLELVGYVARQSLISAMSPAGDLGDFNLQKLASSFQRRMAAGDIQSNATTAICSAAPDLIIWDLCDERLGVGTLKSGTRLTLAHRYVEAGMHEGPISNVLRFGDPGHFNDWREALERLLGFLDHHCLRERLVVNATPWAVRDEDGNDVPDFAGRAQSFNHAADRYYEALEESRVRLIRPPTDRVNARTRGHQWGPAPFHYVDDTYASMLEQLGRAVMEMPEVHVRRADTDGAPTASAHCLGVNGTAECRPVTFN